ncbi:hypothetical protein EWB00_009450 [Schistosoma japonicum]|uniref:Uncharacterized protein n=1 Tax=Schistosoma japonicum TaxID=6182 RepID=A0A4Z2CLY4_SCHJA|nr:hypothetical protein EWB00_009450 [Schistosoma japonicum]TNN05267.1 hypothetical protein EWB00_009450 [Schistosoma japonicum]
MTGVTMWFNNWLERQTFLIVTSQWIMFTITCYILIMGIQDIIGPVALLAGSMENLFQNFIRAVDAQYVIKSDVTFTDDDSKRLFYLLRGPMPMLIFLHLSIIIINAICILSALICRADYFMKLDMLILFLIAIMDTVVFSILIYMDPKANLSMFIEELQKVQVNYTGAETKNFPTLLFNYLHQHFNCCGVHSYTEWFNPTINWKKQVTYDNVIYDIKLPISCCPNLLSNQLPDCAILKESHPPFIQGCAEILMDNSIFHTKSTSERLYALIYFIAHVTILSIYTINMNLIRQKGDILFLYHDGKLHTNNQQNDINDVNVADEVNNFNMKSFHTNDPLQVTVLNLQPSSNDSHFY